MTSTDTLFVPQQSLAYKYYIHNNLIRLDYSLHKFPHQIQVVPPPNQQKTAAVMAASPPPPHAPSYAYSNCHSAKTSTDTIYTRTVSLHYVSADAWSGCCCRRRPSCRADNGTVAPRNGFACASSPMRTGRSDGRTPDTGTASHRSGCGRGR